MPGQGIYAAPLVALRTYYDPFLRTHPVMRSRGFDSNNTGGATPRFPDGTRKREWALMVKTALFPITQRTAAPNGDKQQAVNCTETDATNDPGADVGNTLHHATATANTRK